MDARYLLAQSYSAQLKQFIRGHEGTRRGCEESSTTGAGQRCKCHPDPAICHKPAPGSRKSVPIQPLVSSTASFRRAAGESFCCLQPFRIPQSEPESAPTEANSALWAVRTKTVFWSLWSALMGAATPASLAFSSASAQARS
jgi:hypothetical protein